MEEPRLYEWYDRAEILPLFGEPSNVTSYCDGQWLIAPNVAVCLTKVCKASPGYDFYRDAGPPLSHFGDAGTFIWVADKRYCVRDRNDPGRKFLPAHVDWHNPPQNEIKDEVKKRIIHLFVSADDTGRLLYVGRIQASFGGSAGIAIGRELPERPPYFGTAWFRMKKALPDEVRISLLGPDPGDMDHASLDNALARLNSPTTVADRLEILRRLADYWHSPIRPEDGYSEEELAGKKMPEVLRWWYRWGGRRKEIMSGDNELLDPDNLEYTGDGMLVFFKESQHCSELGTYPEGDDPPVFSREGEGDSWEPANNTLSEHLMLACLDAAVPKFTPYRAESMEDLADDVVRELEKRVPPLPLRPWKWWGGMRFCAKNGAFMKVSDDNMVWIGAKSSKLLRPLKRLLNEGE
jgi:hypothetical protein